MADRVDELRELLERIVDLRELPGPPLEVMDDPRARGHERMHAALALALAGDARALPILRRVYDEPGFVVTNSCMELGWAALGLAMLGDVESIPRFRHCLRINGNGEAIDLAIAVLEGRR